MKASSPMDCTALIAYSVGRPSDAMIGAFAGSIGSSSGSSRRCQESDWPSFGWGSPAQSVTR